jgi:hypothetical protein
MFATKAPEVVTGDPLTVKVLEVNPTLVTVPDPPPPPVPLLLISILAIVFLSV